MANSLGNGLLNKAFWTKVMQEVRRKELVAMKIANVELRKLVKSGDTVHKPYRSAVYGQSYSKGTAFTVQDISATDETLVIFNHALSEIINGFRVVLFIIMGR